MAIEIKVPNVGESITEVTIAEWLKKVGDTVAEDEPVVTSKPTRPTSTCLRPKRVAWCDS